MRWVARSANWLAFNLRSLDGRYVDTTQENFSKSMLISCYSFTAVAQRAEKLMTDGGSLITLSYYGAEKVVSNYRVMGIAKAALEACVRYLAAELGPEGIRVNAISPGAIDAPMLKLSGVPGRMLAPAQVAQIVAWLATPESAPLTGANLRLDP